MNAESQGKIAMMQAAAKQQAETAIRTPMELSIFMEQMAKSMADLIDETREALHDIQEAANKIELMVRALETVSHAMLDSKPPRQKILLPLLSAVVLTVAMLTGSMWLLIEYQLLPRLTPLYRVTFIDRDQERIKKCGYTHSVLGKSKNKHEDDHYDLKTASEIESDIDVLISKNNRGYDVYITPVDPHFYYLLVDDLHEQKKGFEGRYSAFMKSGYTPVLIQESSDDNFQAIIKIPRTKRDSKSLEHETVNKLFKDIDKLYGEGNIQGGVVHAFRLAGFSNRKPSKNGRFTIVKATHSGAICEKARLQVAKMMANRDAEKEKSKAAKVKVARLEAIKSHESDPLGRNDALVVKAYKAEFSRVIGLVEKGCIKGDLDMSTVDFWVAKALLIEGYTAHKISRAIVAVSPDITYRKPGRELEYAELTVANAALHEDVVNALAVGHQAINHMNLK
jgi:hypothetical protein